jgi:predicted small metal-binding protein
VLLIEFIAAHFNTFHDTTVIAEHIIDLAKHDIHAVQSVEKDC